MAKKYLLVAILLLAFGLRVHNLEVQSFWNDEGNSARLSERTIPLIIEGTASDIHPPLYYLLLNQWRKLVGDSEFGLRSLSLFAGLFTVPLTFVLAKNLNAKARRRGGQRKGWLLGWLAALLLAINPAMVYYSQEARMYALLGLWAVLATVLLLRWLSMISNPLVVNGNRRWLWGGAYVLCAAAGLYTHYFFPAVLLVHNVFILIKIIQSPSKPFNINNLPLTIKHWPLLMLTTLLLYAPWLPIFLDQFGSDPVSRPGIGEFGTAVSHFLTFGQTVEVEAGLLWLVFALLGLGLVYGRTKLILPLLGVIVPLGMMFATGTTEAEFHKFLMVAAPFWLIWLAAAFTYTNQRGLRLLVSICLLVLSWGMMQSLQNMYTDPTYTRADYRGMASRILAEDHPNAGVILNAANQWEAFTYYFPDDGNVYPLPEGRSRPNPDEIDATLSQIAAQHGRLYAIFWGEAQRDPERLIERWLDAHAFKATDEWYGDVRFVTYAIPSAPATEMATAVSLPFGESITLNGYTLGETRLRPGDIVEVTLFWETAVPLQTRYKVFLHLLDANGNLVSQRDSEPGGGLALTTTWQPGDVMLDNHGLLIPTDLPSGNYELLLGLYDQANPADRLSITSPDGETNAFFLARVTVVE
ncbi:glycosyltransferase family 39 protein [Candidatus Leptofilum sp.]|uniref:glycosyltransferase family 39 protein n=1 Tax=Candidatus Leptofilum sp. TaxID=3241576 RepID=UPI003B59E8CC